ncbi:MAG: tyrosine-type recombinase/integrase [Gordonia polyisoprenivorans]|nr:tyrosine-type recombinase/integrase [Gordonia polyisoprenivorans]
MASRRTTKRTFGRLRQLPSGRWQAAYQGPDARVYKAPSTFAAKLDAEAWLSDRRREIDRELWSPATAETADPTLFVEFAENWLATRTVSGRPLKPRTRAHYRRILDVHLLPEFASTPVRAISVSDVRKWHAALLPDRPTMRAHAYSLMRTLMNEAVNQELIDANPCRISGASSSATRHKPRPATLAELDAINEAMPERLRAMVLLAAWCALRFGETVELRRGDLELPEDNGVGIVRVRRAAVRAEGGTFSIGTPKSDAGVRDVAIPPHVVPSLREHLERFVAHRADALVFPSDAGSHIQPSTLYRHFYKARTEAKRDDLRWHDLRHTGAVMAAGTGATLAELMDRLGHSTPAAAMRYQHAAQGRDRKIAEALSRIVGDAP